MTRKPYMRCCPASNLAGMLDGQLGRVSCDTPGVPNRVLDAVNRARIGANRREIVNVQCVKSAFAVRRLNQRVEYRTALRVNGRAGGPRYALQRSWRTALRVTANLADRVTRYSRAGGPRYALHKKWCNAARGRTCGPFCFFTRRSNDQHPAHGTRRIVPHRRAPG